MSHHEDTTRHVPGGRSCIFSPSRSISYQGGSNGSPLIYLSAPIVTCHYHFWADWHGSPHRLHVMRNKQRFIRRLRILARNDFWDASRWLGGAYVSAGAHPDHNQQPVLIRDEKVKWLDFGATPPGASPALVSHLGEGGLRSGYTHTILWRRVRQIALTTDGLCTLGGWQ